MEKLPKTVFIWLILVMLVFLSVPSSDACAGNAVEKLGRGLANIFSGWLELPLEIGRKTDRDGEVAGMFSAPLSGLLKAIGRTLAGVYDAATFLVPLPRRYEPLIRPEFVGGTELD